MPSDTARPVTHKKNGTLTIGLLVNSAEDKYENAILHGAHAVVHSAHANLLCFTSGALRSYHGFEAKRNILFDLVNPGVVDGLVICGTLAHNITLPEINALCERYKPLPMVSIAMLLEGIPGILVNSAPAMGALLDHLLHDHAYRRVAFIRGPQGQLEAEERYRAYLDALERHQLPFDPGLVAQGDYTRASGYQVMQRLLENEPRIDAVVCANDSMALGGMEAIAEHGLRVPQDIAITGFDDVEEGRYQETALTTIRQPVQAQGRMAAQVLLQKIAGEEVPPHITVPAELVIRQSCGCPVHPAQDLQAGADRHHRRRNLAMRREAFYRSVALAANPLTPGETPAWAPGLFDALADGLEQGREDEFRAAWVSAVQHGSLGSDERVWEAVLGAVRETVAPYLPGAASLWNHIWGMIAEMKIARQAQLRLSGEQRTFALRGIGETMVTTFNMDGLLDVIAQDLPRMGVKACYLSLYENPQKPATWSRLILAYDRNGRQTLPAAGKRFASRRLIPGDLLEKPHDCALVVEALYSKTDQLGFVVLALSPGLTAMCGALRGQLSSAIQGVLLLQERQKVEAQLQKHQNELEDIVSKRTAELIDSNTRLEQEIFERKKAEAEIRALNIGLEQRVQERTLQLEAANKELEAFTYSVSHDLRAPLRGIAGLTRILQDEHAQNLDPAGKELFERILSSTRQMNALINDLLSFSKLGQKALNKQYIPGWQMENLAQEIVADLKSQSPERVLDFSAGPVPGCQADFALLRQVLVNLLSNAFKYSRNQPTAHIRFGFGGGAYYVSDDGVGFDMQYANRLFGVFQRLHPGDEFEGTGVGLATAHRIITRHGGTIWASSTPGMGATFYFTIEKKEGQA